MEIDLAIVDYAIFKDGGKEINISSPYDNDIEVVMKKLCEIEENMIKNMGVEIINTDELEIRLSELRHHRQDYYELTYDIINIIEFGKMGIIYKTEDDEKHNYFGPSVIYTEEYPSYKLLSEEQKLLYYIHGQEFSKEEWEKHPDRIKHLREFKLKRVLK